MPLPGIPTWTDQEIELYHGTLDIHVVSVLSGIDLRVCKHLRDFGRGFYTTTNLAKAQSWANDLSLQSSGAAPAVIRFIVPRNDLAGLDCLFFVRGDPHAIDFWSFVQYSRNMAGDHNRKHTGWYDIGAGPVTGSWQKQTVIPNADQVSFHTDHAVAVLEKCKGVRVV